MSDRDQVEKPRVEKPRRSGVPLWAWLLIWWAIALAIRFSYLSSKDTWMDEIATILFSLGNSSRLILLDQIIDLDAVLRPLQITPGASAADVVRHLLIEDNHPPTYFVIAHWWMAIVHRFYHPSDLYPSLWAARALPAFFGALAVPATYLLAWISFRQQTTSLICSALMAVSPLSVYVSQEARHYSLAILMVIASLCCFVAAVQTLQQQKQVSKEQMLIWISINLLSVTVHYFCGLTVLAEGMTLSVLLVRQCQKDSSAWRRSHWLRIYGVAAATLAGLLLWLPVLTNFYGSRQTSFLKTDYKSINDWIDPIVFPFVHAVYAVMSPVMTGYSWQAVVAIVLTSLGMLCFAGWLMFVVVRSLRDQIKQSAQAPHQRAGILAMAGFLLMANLLFLLICYGTGFNVARSHRYSFVYFPSIPILVGAGLAPLWKIGRKTGVLTKATISLYSLTRISARRLMPSLGLKSTIQKHRLEGKAFVAATLCVGLISSLFVVNNISLKIYNADRFIELIQQETSYQPIIGTVAFTTEKPIVIGLDIMTVAWEIERNFNPALPDSGWHHTPQFVLVQNAEGSETSVETRLVDTLDGMLRPFDLWMMGDEVTEFESGLEAVGCDHLTNGTANKGNYSYSHHVCR